MADGLADVAPRRWWERVGDRALSIFRRHAPEALKQLQKTCQQIDGAFGGLRYSPSWAGSWSFVSEYDALDYKNFPFAEETHVGGRRHGISRVVFNHFACWLNIESTMWMNAS